MNNKYSLITYNALSTVPSTGSITQTTQSLNSKNYNLVKAEKKKSDFLSTRSKTIKELENSKL